jgi:hypothetical protein
VIRRKGVSAGTTERDRHDTEADTQRWRVFDIVTTPIGKRAGILVTSPRSKRSKLLPPTDVELLLSCDSYDTVAGHSARLYRERIFSRIDTRTGMLGGFLRFLRNRGVAPEDIPLRKTTVARIAGQIRTWIADGFLISEDELKREVRIQSSRTNVRRAPDTTGSDAITVVGIPTCGRPDSLQRSLATFLDNFHRHGRTPQIIVLDDSRAAEDQHRNLHLLREFARGYSGEMRLMNRRQRAAFAKALAAKADVDPDLMLFAFMGNAAYDRSEGGCRNAFLLLSRGEMALQTDDDTFCRPSPAPEIRSGLTLNSKRTSDSYWFFRSFDDAIAAVQPSDEDFLQLHERVLGRYASDLIAAYHANDLNLGDARPAFFRRVPLAKIRMSLVGPVGDSCLFDDLHRLLLEGESFQRLINPVSEYHEKLATRQVIRCVNQLTITDTPRCIGMNFAVDNRELLPPCMPVQARCDGILGDIMMACFPHAFAANLPYAIPHRPPEDRSPDVSDVFDMAGRVRVNDVIAEVIYDSQRMPYTDEPEENLQLLGRYFRGLARWPKDEFEHRIRDICARAVWPQGAVMEGRLHRSSAPKCWKDDVRRFIEVKERSILTADFCAGADAAEPDGAPLRRVMDLFGRLLIEWPRVCDAMHRFEPGEIAEFLSTGQPRRNLNESQRVVSSP